MGIALAVDGFIANCKTGCKVSLYVQDIASYRNQKGVWGVISQGACDAKAKVRFVQSDWPGEAKK
jgi:hypothetical protein